MTLKQALAALKKGGTAQNRKIYGRHGVTAEMFGVSYALQKKLAREAGTDHELAQGLWAFGNHDARILATMVCEPTKYTSRELDAMVRELGDYVLTDAFSGVRIEKAVEDLLRLVHRGNRTTWTTVRQSLA